MRLCVFALILLPLCLLAATNDLSGALQKGLFEEEANRNLEAAIQAYQSVAARFDKDRQLAATAIFRLGECYRKLGKTNEAAVQYERIVREFADQNTLVTLGRQNLVGMGSVATLTGPQKSIADEQEVGRLETELLDTRARARRIADRLEGYNSAKNFEDMLPFVSDEALKELFRQNAELGRKFESLKASRDKDDPELATAKKQFDESQRLLESADKRYQDLLDQQLRGLTAKAAAIQNQLDLARGLTTVAGPRVQDAALLERLKKLSQAEARQLLPTLVPDELLTRLLGQYQATEAKRAQEANNYGPDHPEMRSLDNLLKKLDEQIKERVDGIIKALEIRIAAASSTAGSPGAETQSATTDDEEKEIHRIREMIKNSPDLIEAKDQPRGATPLHSAAGLGQLRVATFLIANGADVGAKDRMWNGASPLHYAADAGHKGMIELLLSSKADADAAADSGETPLHFAARKGFKSIVELLLANRADVNAKLKGGATPLHYAVANGFKNVAETLLKAKADLNAVTTNSISSLTGGGSYVGAPLHIAISRGDRAIWELLLANGADVNVKDHNGRTPLRIAVEREQTAAIETLLAKNANANIADYQETATLLIAVERQKVEFVKTLLEHNADPEAAGWVDRRLSGGGGSVNRHTYPLQSAIELGNLEVLELLLERGAEVNSPRTWSETIYPIFGALNRERTNALKLLLKFKADPNVKSSDGMTPLMTAVNIGSKETVEILLAAGADVKIAKEDGVTPLHMAVRDDKRDIAELLLAKGADPNAKSRNGQTPLDWTKAKSYSAMPPQIRSIPIRQLNTIGTDGAGDNQPNAIAELLRRHGALDDFPDFTSIRITRGTLKPIPVFGKDADALNHFTLLETILTLLSRNMIVSGNSSAAPSQVFPFPDLSRIRIQRSSPSKPTERKEMIVNILTATNSIDCTKDLPLEFGDVIEIPEREHALSDQPVALTPQQRNELEKCTAKIVRFMVKGETKEIPLFGNGAFLRSTLQYSDVQRILRSSSDLSRVKVKRTDSKAGQTREIIVDAQRNKEENADLWLRDGDVIEVPDKP